VTRVRKIILAVFGGMAAFAMGLFAFQTRVQGWLVDRYTPSYLAPSAEARSRSGALRLAQVGTGVAPPTDIQFVPGAAGVAVELEKNGRARVLRLGEGKVVTPGPVVFEVRVRTDSELGLLGLTFHPRYEKNGRFFVNYTPSDGAQRTVVSEWTLPSAELGKKAGKETRTILEVEQPYPNHNAGQLAFGPDGMLYVGLGDGGWRADPKGHGQNRATLLGSMLRLDVDAAGVPYAVPKDNPFVGQKGVRPEIWAYGLRNPWRYSFDPHGRLVVADVGQDSFEEVDLVAAGDNLGWKHREAAHCFEPKTGCPTAGLVEPIFEYGRELGTSITGGYVYTGDTVEALRDKYLFADFTSGNIWALALPSAHLGAKTGSARLLGKWPYLISAFGRDAAGEVYVADYSEGRIFRFAPR
jgi:glucose/arabinose dehydrogenase